MKECWKAVELLNKEHYIRKHEHHKHGSYLNDWGSTNGRASYKHLEVWLSRSVAEIQPFQSSSYLPWKVKARQRKANPVKMYCTDSLEWKVDISIVVSLSNLPNPNLTKQPDFWSSKSLVFSLCFSHLPSGHLCTSVMETASSAEEPTSADGSSGLWLSLQVQTCKEALDSLKRHKKTSKDISFLGFYWFPLQRLTRSYKVFQRNPMREIQICDRYYDWGKDVARRYSRSSIVGLEETCLNKKGLETPENLSAPGRFVWDCALLGVQQSHSYLLQGSCKL